MTDLTYQNGQGASALDQQQELDRLDGYAVASGCAPAVGDGLVVDVAAGTVTMGGDGDSVDLVEVAAGSVSLDAADPEHPRKDVVYVDPSGTVAVEAGVPQPALPNDATRFETFQPAPPSMADVEGVVLAEVWVGAGTGTLAGDDVRDRRQSATAVHEQVISDEAHFGSVSTGEASLGSIAPDRSERNPSYNPQQQPVQSGPLTVCDYEFVDNPVLSSDDIDGGAQFVSDPFWVLEDGTFYMFFEIMREGQTSKDIGLATSLDGINWDYQSAVIDTVDASFPYVFKWNGNWYMVPHEDNNNTAIWTTDSFPTGWSKEQELVSANLEDTILINWKGTWYLIGADGQQMMVHYSDDLLGSYTAHPANPIIDSPLQSRPAGRPIIREEYIELFTMMNYKNYGNGVLSQRFELSKTDASLERLIEPLLVGHRNNESGDRDRGWNSRGMHHIDPMPPFAGGNQLVLVNGHYDTGDGNEWSIGVWRRGPQRVESVATLTEDQSVDPSSWTQIQFDSRIVDTIQGWGHPSIGSNPRYMARTSGDYEIETTVRVDGLSDGDMFELAVYLRGYPRRRVQQTAQPGDNDAIQLSTVLQNVNEGDDIDIRLRHNSDSAATVASSEEWGQVRVARQ